MRIIGLAGQARSGKSTVAMHLIDAHGFEEYAFAEPIKQALQQLFDLTDEQLYGADKDKVIPWLGRSPRYLAQTLGTEWGRELVAQDLWTRLAQQWLQRAGRYVSDVVFSDVRFENEAEFVRRNGGVILHLVRDDAPDIEAHISESGVAFSKGDLIVHNNGTVTDLAARINDILIDIAA